MKAPVRVWFALRELGFSHADSDQIAGIFKQMAESGKDYKPWAVAHAVCGRTGLSPAVWHEALTRAFAEPKELINS